MTANVVFVPASAGRPPVVWAAGLAHMDAVRLRASYARQVERGAGKVEVHPIGG